MLDLDPDAAADRDVHATLHGLYWLAVNLSARSPLLVAVDDVHWADEPSVRWLAYLARRLERLPIALLATVRTEAGPAGPGSDTGRAALDALVGEGARRRLEPAPLSTAAVAELLEAGLAAPPEPGFTAACQRPARRPPRRPAPAPRR